MSDHDLDLPAEDDLGPRIATALRVRAERTPPPTLVASAVRAEARRQDRRRHLQIGTAVAAAALVVAVLVGLRPGTDDATYYVGPGPTTGEPVPEPLHLVLDDDAVTLTDAAEWLPELSTGGEAMSPEGPSSSEDLVYSVAGTIDSPVLFVTIRTTTGPMAPQPAPAVNQRSIMIGDRPALLIPRSDGPVISLRWDATHEISAASLGIDEAATLDALETVQIDGGGRWSLAAPPAGLEEVARTEGTIPGTGTDRLWSSDLRYLNAPGTFGSEAGSAARLSIVPVASADPDEELLVRALQFRSASGAIERSSIRDHAGFVVTAPRSEAMERIVYLWVEPGRGLVTLWFDSDDRARTDRLAASVREAGPDEWATIIRACTGTVQAGTVADMPDGMAGGRCRQP